MKTITKIRGILGLVAALATGGASAANAQGDGMFRDVPKTHWAYQAVKDLKDRGILEGYPKETVAAPAPAPSNPSPPKPARKPRPRARRKANT